MLKRRPEAVWAVPGALAILVMALAAAVVVAREPRGGAAGASAPRPVIARSFAGPPDGGVSYGAGFVRVVAAPRGAASRRALRGRWRELGHRLGRVLIEPAGTRSRYFQVALAAVAPEGAARLEVLTSTGQRAIALVRPGAVRPISFGPLSVGREAAIGLAFCSVQPHSPRPGKRLLLSPLASAYLAPGQSVMKMSALAEPGRAQAWGIGIAGPMPRAVTGKTAAAKRKKR